MVQLAADAIRFGMDHTLIIDRGKEDFLLNIAILKKVAVDRAEEKRDEIIRKILEKEVAVNIHFIPVPMMTYYKNLGYHIEDFPQAYSNFACEISLPVYYDLSDEQVDFVADTVIEAVNKVINQVL